MRLHKNQGCYLKGNFRLALMQRTGDPLAEAFAQRDKPEVLAAARQKLMDEYQTPRKAKAKANKRKESRR